MYFIVKATFTPIAYWKFLIVVWHSYNPALAVPPAGWPIPARPQTWYLQHPAASIRPVPLGMTQQPLFPIQPVTPPLSSSMTSALQTSLQITPPGLPTPAPSAPLPQPLFPIGVNNNLLTQNSPFSIPMLSTSIPLSSQAELNSSTDRHSSINSSLASSYSTPSIQGLNFSHRWWL